MATSVSGNLLLSWSPIPLDCPSAGPRFSRESLYLRRLLETSVVFTGQPTTQMPPKRPFPALGGQRESWVPVISGNVLSGKCVRGRLL